MLRSRYLLPLFDGTVRSWASEARLLRWLTFLWITVGLAVLFSASYVVAEAEVGDGFRYFKVQLLWILLGLGLFKWVVHTPLRELLRIAGGGVLLLLVLISLTLLPQVGVTVNGATRWLSLGPFLIQPSELMKPFLVLQAARIFGKWDSLSGWLRVLWLGVFSVVLGTILLQPNLSTAAICGLTLWLIALASGLPLRYLSFTALGGVGLAVLSISLKEYQRIRIVSFLNPWADPTATGYQLIQSLLAIGSGEMWGTGFGLSQQKLFYLPIQYTDFIFAVYAEEFGFLGSLLLLLFLALYGTLALIIALRASTTTYRLIAVGGMVLLVGQSLLNIGVASGALPTTGLPFPLVSYGGSSMLSSLLTAGLLVRVARESYESKILPLPGGRRTVQG